MKQLLLPLLALGLCIQALAQQSKRDSLENILRHAGADTNRVRTLNNASETYWSNNPQKSKQYADEALLLAQKLNYTLGIGIAYANLGVYYWSQGKYQEAIKHINMAVPYYEKINYQKGMAGCYNNIGLCLRNLGDFPQAIANYFKALKIHEKLGSRQAQAQIYNNIGLVFKSQEKYDRALHYYWLSFHKSEGIDPRNQAGALDNIGAIYLLKKEYSTAISYLNQSRNLFETHKEPMGLVVCDTDLGKTYTAMNQYARAETYFRRAWQEGTKLGYNSGVLSSLLGLGEIRLKTDRASESFEFFDNALTLSNQLKHKDGRLRSYAGLATAYEHTGNFTEAYHYQSKWIALKDSVFNEETAKKITRVQAEYESEKKQAEIEILKKDQQVSKLWRNAVGAGLVALLIIAGLIVSRQRLKILKDQILLSQSKVVAEKNLQLEKQTQLLEDQAKILADQAKQLQVLDEAKSRFFTNISHEFRTPLTLIIGTLSEKLHLLNEVSETVIRRPEINVMHRNAQRLLQLINQLLDLSKIESGQMELALQTDDIKPLLDVVMASFSSLADQRHIHQLVQLPAQQLLVSYDADQLEKVVTNLLSNAFKFTPDGGEIRLTAEQIVIHEKAFVQLVVEDSGIGIAPDQMERVFDRFYRGASAQAARQPGTGIGLSLVKEIVQLHNGTIQIENKVGPGARFVVLLPCAEPTEVTNPLSTLTFLQKDQPFFENTDDQLTLTPVIDNEDDRPLLLIVEDHGDLRAFIRNQMQRYYRVLESENGLQGLKAAQENLPDLIISDWMMPDMDGIEFCRQSKLDERTSHIPFILLTALSAQDNKLTGLETGADEYLTKPFDSRELIIRSQNLIESRQKLRERFGREIRIQPKDITVTSTDEKFLIRVLKIAEDNLGNADFTPEQFGREIGLSRMQLHRKLIALTGQATGDFLRVMRLKRAAQLLEGRTGSVSEIAYGVGFNSLSYFAKCFREQFGVLPNEYAASLSAQV
jgi:signal transduction histidine kinase/DNA-binding response OmpR family regulator